MLVPAAGLDFTPVPRCSAYSSTPQHESWYAALGKRACKTSPQTSCELQLSNRYDLLNIDDFPPLPAVSELGATPGRATQAGGSISLAGSPVAVAPAGASTSEAPAAFTVPAALTHLEPGKSATHAAGTSPRHKLLRDVVRWHLWSRHAAVKPSNPERNRLPSDRNKAHLSPPCPLLPPTALIMGDFIIRQVCFTRTVTRCLPGSTVTIILNKLP